MLVSEVANASILPQCVLHQHVRAFPLPKSRVLLRSSSNRRSSVVNIEPP
jgi:hypothetical protein